MGKLDPSPSMAATSAAAGSNVTTACMAFTACPLVSNLISTMPSRPAVNAPSSGSASQSAAAGVSADGAEGAGADGASAGPLSGREDQINNAITAAITIPAIAAIMRMCARGAKGVVGVEDGMSDIGDNNYLTINTYIRLQTAALLIFAPPLLAFTHAVRVNRADNGLREIGGIRTPLLRHHVVRPSSGLMESHAAVFRIESGAGGERGLDLAAGHIVIITRHCGTLIARAYTIVLGGAKGSRTKAAGGTFCICVAASGGHIRACLPDRTPLLPVDKRSVTFFRKPRILKFRTGGMFRRTPPHGVRAQPLRAGPRIIKAIRVADAEIRIVVGDTARHRSIHAPAANAMPQDAAYALFAAERAVPVACARDIRRVRARAHRRRRGTKLGRAGLIPCRHVLLGLEFAGNAGRVSERARAASLGHGPLRAIFFFELAQIRALIDRIIPRFRIRHNDRVVKFNIRGLLWIARKRERCLAQHCAAGLRAFAARRIRGNEVCQLIRRHGHCRRRIRIKRPARGAVGILRVNERFAAYILRRAEV